MAAEGIASVEYFFTPWVLWILPQQCHDEFFVNFNFFHVACLKIALSKGLGYGIILGSVLVKLPQIIKVIQAGSVTGLSVWSFFLELFSLTANLAYNYAKGFPFSTWGEAVFMSIQTSLLIVLYYHYTDKALVGVLFLPVYAGIVWVLAGGLTPMTILTQLQATNVPMLALSRLMQIGTNFKNGHTGQLSGVTLFLLWIGSLARVFTTVQETGDFLLLVTYLVSFSLNTILFLQLIYYWKVPVVKEDEKKKAQ